MIMLAVMLLAGSSVSAQQLFRLTQYFQNPQAINPATTGIEGFMDVKIGYRQQWSGLDGAPETYYISAHAPLRSSSTKTNYQNNSLRISSPSLYSQSGGSQEFNSAVKHGIGGYITSDNQGIFAQTSGFLSYASHFLIGDQLRLSLGVSGGIVNQQIDLSGVTVVEQNDPTYQAYQNQQGQTTNFDVNAGIFLYNDLFYVGYSAARVFQNRLYADSEITAQQQLTHFGMLGVRLDVSDALLLVPGAFIGYDGINPLTYDVGARLKLRDLLWFGASYRNTETVAAMAGVSISNTFNVSYSYDYGFSGINNFQSGIHEITLGFELFNQRQVAPYLW
uniref:Type IX secretion system membrane protein PorP/SprF n=1 Tax=Roseihalotalea indica TaxID=2867963 RepID=A0AA49JB75_9BACT|nr:type IX secretion system membrane protein PorP/SprF [Tunicatimonas sp. TK19036]